MKCPIDQTEMEIGTIAPTANVWQPGKHDFKLFGNPIYVYAFRCPKCGKIELTTKGDK